jgi:hypothetical protein
MVRHRLGVRKMRDLLFKNLTSSDHKRKIISSSEIADSQGIHSIIHRHFICMVKEVSSFDSSRPAPYLYVLKEHRTKEQKERFFCKVKGSVCVVHNERFYLVVFMHSLKIDLVANPQPSSLT